MQKLVFFEAKLGKNYNATKREKRLKEKKKWDSQ